MSLLTPLYAVTVGLLLTGAAALAEQALRTRRWPARLVWAAALALTASAPLWGPRLAAGGGSDAPPAALALAELEADATALDDAAGPHPLAAATAALRALDRPDRRVALAWLALGALGLAVAALSLARLHRRIARMPRGRVGGDEVRLAPDFGPACVGVTRARVVLPRWILGLERSDLDLVLRHERSHGDARDPLLLTLGLLALATAPWNPALWWQIIRLRRAVELDCDARVLASGAPPAAYGRVLVRVLTHVRSGPFPAPALLDPVSFLERRLTLMRQTRPGTWTQTLAAGAVAIGLVVVACETPAPTAVAPPAATDVAEGTTVERTDATAGTLARAVQIPGVGALPENAVLVVDGVIVRGDALKAFQLEPSRVESVEIVKSEQPVISIRMKPASEAGATKDKTTFEAREVEPVRKDRTDQQGQGVLLERKAAPHPEALVFVDGEPLEGGMTALQARMAEEGPDWIKSVEVIKGEAARAILGDEARNGVIRVTTKKGGGLPHP